MGICVFAAQADNQTDRTTIAVRYEQVTLLSQREDAAVWLSYDDGVKINSRRLLGTWSTNIVIYRQANA
jgi:hypothetical protein